jgi:hypothetical protein
MALSPQIFHAQVFHQRLSPKINTFAYRVYYVALPMPIIALPSRLMSFRHADHGAHVGSDCGTWVREILARHGLDAVVKDIILVTMPRVLGYAFNPVSFYCCRDDGGGLRAVLCEVHNTFGEHHNYLCARPDHAPIGDTEWLEAEKLFHVSPFLLREGFYRFRFSWQGNRLSVWIDHYSATGEKLLQTALVGRLAPLSRRSLRHAFWAHPLVTLKTVLLIHWQALKLMRKGIAYSVKPPQLHLQLSVTNSLPKCKAGESLASADVSDTCVEKAENV